MSDNPYVRVYQSVADDAKFVGIFDDDHHFSTWVRLLMAADALWPASCPVPAHARKASIKALCEAGLIDVTGSRFRVRGLDAERNRRSEKARASAEQRWSNRSTDAMQPHSVSNAARPAPASARSRTSSLVEEPAREVDDGRADLEAFLLVTRRAPTPRQRQVLDGVLLIHDVTGPQWSADIILSHPDDPIGAVIAADKEYRGKRIADAQAAEKKPPQPRRKGSGLTGINAELAAILHKQYAEESAP